MKPDVAHMLDLLQEALRMADEQPSKPVRLVEKSPARRKRNRKSAPVAPAPVAASEPEPWVFRLTSKR